MSIITKTGDQGTTGLMYNRRVNKTHPRVEAYGTVDELNAAIGLARANAVSDELQHKLGLIQKDLVLLMGELATAREDLERYSSDGYDRIDEDSIVRLEGWARELEGESTAFRGWAMPGRSNLSAALDLARTVCRRSERFVWSLKEQDLLADDVMLRYLNRLSDLFWVFARWIDSEPGEQEKSDH